MDAEQEARVWARVRGERVLPLGDCARCAGIYRWLYKRGICRETAAGLLKQQTEQRGDDVVYKRGHDRTESGADDHADCKVDHVAAQGELFEFR